MPERVAASSESVCPHRGVGCGIHYDADRGSAVGWNGPVNTRGELCPKGAAAWDVVDHDERLTTPLVQVDGRLVEATWDETFDHIKREFFHVAADYGPGSTFFFLSSSCMNEENYLLRKTARALGANNVDNCARLCHASTVAAMGDRLGTGAITNSLSDLGEADVFLVTGANPAEQHPVIFCSYLPPALKSGTTMVHVNPRENQMTKAVDIHLPVKPGFDIPLLNAMAAVVVEEGLVDEAFVTERTTGLKTLREHLSGLDIDAEAERAGADSDDLRAATNAYGEADRAAVFTGMGMNQHHCGTDNVQVLINLPLLTGNVGKVGIGVNPLRGQNNVQGTGDAGALSNVLPGYRPVTDDDARAAIADVWGFEPPNHPGLAKVEATHRFGDEMRTAYVLGESPTVTEPNVNRVREAFGSLDFCIAHDVFPTETVEFMDVVLPGSIWAGKSGTVTNTNRQVVHMNRNAAPPGDAHADLDILREFTARVAGLDAPATPEGVFDELWRVTPICAGMSYDGTGTGSQRWSFPEGVTEGAAVLHINAFESGLRTAPFRAVEHVDPADPVADDEFVLVTGRVLQQFSSGTLTRRSGMLMRMRGEDSLQIRPDDAAARGIDDDAAVRVENDRGEVAVTAEVTPVVRRGTVFATFHYADPSVNRLTGDALDPTAKIPECKHSTIRVTIESEVVADD